MSKKVILLLTLFSFNALAGFENRAGGARPASLSGAVAAIGGNTWSTLYNPAGLAECRGVEASAFFIPQQFGLKELRTIGLSASVPIGIGGVGMIVEQFGFELYRESSVSIGFGASIDHQIALGGTLNVVRIEVERYGSIMVPSYDFGALLQIIDGLNLGFDWRNVTGSKIGRTGESLPQVQCVGMCYVIAADSRIALELEKDIRFPFSVKTGFEQSFLETLRLRIGFASNPDKFSCGLGARFGSFEFAYAGFSHPQLGWTHQIEITFTLNE